MWIIPPDKHEGIFNLDAMSHIEVIRLSAADGEELFSLGCVLNNSANKEFIGSWDTSEKADAALKKIIRSNHEGHKEVYLDA